jgi:cell division ATPase FtsA
MRISTLIQNQPLGKKADNLGVSMHIVTASNHHVEAVENSIYWNQPFFNP